MKPTPNPETHNALLAFMLSTARTRQQRANDWLSARTPSTHHNLTR